MFNHVGDGTIVKHYSEHTLQIIGYPSLALRESPYTGRLPRVRGEVCAPRYLEACTSCTST